jgi:acetolactate synthase-1/2/3 large subunit
MQTQHPVWDLVVQYLQFIGTDVVFGIPSDDLGLLRAMRNRSLRMVIAKDQRNALFMAAGYALIAKKLGVCAVGKGPALTNTITGLLESASISAPVLLIGVGTGRDRVGTHAFQEADQIALVKPIVKWAYRVESAERLLWALKRAVFLAVNGCPGPVYIEVPEDLTDILAGPAEEFSAPATLRNTPSLPELDAAVKMLRAAHQPILLVGGGALNNPPGDGAVEKLAERLGAVIFTTASGRGAIDESHPLYGGVAGLYTAAALRELWEQADIVVALGSRLEETATLLMGAATRARPVIQINLRIDHFSHLYEGLKLWGDCNAAVQYWASELNKKPETYRGDWVQRIGRLKQQALQQRDEFLRQAKFSRTIHVAEVLAGIEKTMPSDGILVQENGLLDMWSYFHPYFSFGPGQLSLVPSEQTSLGFGAAAAIGAKAALPNRTVIALVGDGAFNIFRSDLATAIDNHLPITYVILNNGSFGWLEYQWRCHDQSDPGFQFSWDTPTFPGSIARLEVTDKDQIEEMLKRAYQHNADGRTALIDVRISELEVAPGVSDFYGKIAVHSKEGAL